MNSNFGSPQGGGNFNAPSGGGFGDGGPAGWTPPPVGDPGKGLQIASLVCGILNLVTFWGGYTILLGIAGLICGIMGKNKSKLVGAPTGMGTAGIVTSCIGLGLTVIAIIFIFVVAGGILGSLGSYL